jgi:two-component system LytT family response regulator
VRNLVVEYQKDIKVYFGIVVVATAYQFYCRARPKPQAAPTDRLVVQTGTAERILRLEQVEFLAAARNYVSVHAEGREYIVRETMNSLGRRLPGAQFVRTHRSFIVNVDKVREVRNVDSQLQVVLHSGQVIPLSRGYRDGFRSMLSGVRADDQPG